MSEITKLYENAGIGQVCNTCELRGYKRLCPTKELCVRTNPPFTAEKQLELIKWLSKRRLLNIAFSNDKKTYQLSNNKCTGSFCSDLATAIATLAQCELDFCTEEEKQQVKGILE